MATASEKSHTPELPRVRDTRTPVTIVGGGLAGLVAAISLAESGARVILHEARAQLGGRADTDRGDYRVNLGPHALYRHGGFEAWLLARDLLPPTTYPSLTGLRMLHRGKLRRFPAPLLRAFRLAGAGAPEDRDFRSWASEQVGAAAAEAAVGLAALPTFHHDPGELSAAFVQERLQRSSLWRPVYYLRGGWAMLVDLLARRASELGVECVLRSKLTALPEAPAIVAVDLPAAARLFDDASIAWPGPKTALLDLSLRNRRGDPTAVLSLDDRIYAARYNASDPTLAPAGEALIQASAGVRDGESQAAAIGRIESVLDRGYRDWRERVVWQRRGRVDGGAGAADPPGTSWRDRPALSRGDGRWLVGDRTAAPGVLSEVSFESARAASRELIEKLLS